MSMLPLNGWMTDGWRPSGITRSMRLGVLDLDVRAGRVEVIVVRHDVPGVQDRVEQDALGRPALMRRNDVR